MSVQWDRADTGRRFCEASDVRDLTTEDVTCPDDGAAIRFHPRRQSGEIVRWDGNCPHGHAFTIHND